MKIISQDENETLISTSFLRQTDKAILVENIDDEEVWLPLSQVEVIEQCEGMCEVIVPNWLAESKGVI